jgi:hypothetical protein
MNAVFSNVRTFSHGNADRVSVGVLNESEEIDVYLYQ